MGRFTILKFIQDQRWEVAPVEHVDLTGKTVVVIGANVGLGFEAAKHFASMNPKRLVLGCRNQEKGQAALQGKRPAFRLGRSFCVPNNFDHGQPYRPPPGLRMLSLHSSTSLNLRPFQHLQTLSFAVMLKSTSSSIMPGLHSCIIHLPQMAGKRRESLLVFSFQSTLGVNVLFRIQVNHLSAMLLTILLLPCLFEAVSSGTSPNPRVVIVSSGIHYWMKFSKTESVSNNIFQKLSDRDYCTSWWDIPFYI